MTLTREEWNIIIAAMQRTVLAYHDMHRKSVADGQHQLARAQANTHDSVKAVVDRWTATGFRSVEFSKAQYDLVGNVLVMTQKAADFAADQHAKLLEFSDAREQRVFARACGEVAERWRGAGDFTKILGTVVH